MAVALLLVTMRCLFAFLLAGCTAGFDPGPAAEPDDVPDDDDVEASSYFTPTWSYSTPAGMIQRPEVDVAISGALELGVRGFDQIANARAGQHSLRVVPRRGALRPLRLLTETTTNRSLVWMLEPLGVIWHNPVVWDDGTVDGESRVLYHLLEGGLLDTTWSRAPEGTALSVELSSPPEQLANGLYRLGALRIRVVTGSATLAASAIIVTPQLGRAQLIVYEDNLYDTASLDAAGALLSPIAGKVSQRPGAVEEKHVRFQSETLAIDQVYSLGGTPATHDTPVLLADKGQLYVGSPDSWRLTALATKIIKTGPIGMRRMRYVRGAVGGQTFNFYVFSPRGTITLWPVGRITTPYRLSRFGNVTLADFPGTDNDYSEDLPGGTNVMHTRAAWAWDATTLIEAATLESKVALAHTGQEGNSVDGGWRHTASGMLTSFAVGNAQGFVSKTVPTAAYRFDPGDAAFAVYPTFSVYHQQRAWSGAWANREDRVAALRVDPTIYFGTIKSLHNTDVLAAGEKLTVSQVIHTGAPSADAVQLRARYSFAAPLREGMLDLDSNAKPTASWDLAIAGDEDEVGVVFQ